MRYAKDPYWLTLKYDQVVFGNPDTVIPKGTRVFYYPNTKTMLTGDKAEQAARDFEAARQDEEGF